MTDDAAYDTESAPQGDSDRAHLETVPAGSGCTEIWEHLSAQRDQQESEC